MSMIPDSGVGDVFKPLSDACEQLIERLWAGNDCRAEDFLPPGPIPEAQADAALELIYTEFVVREELGRRPAPAEYFARFPHLRDRFERMLQFGALLEDTDDLLSAESLPEPSSVVEPPTSEAQPLPETHDLRPAGKTRSAQGDEDPWSDQYEILETIGRGGMGIVYKARQVALNRIVALKQIVTGKNAAPGDRARFRREAEHMARLRHANIVSVYAVGERDGCPFFSMEFVEGGNLAQKISNRPQPQRQAAAWVETLARAVHYAHGQGLVHRDLKPSNVVLTTDDVPKITDYGLAKLVGAPLPPAEGPEPRPAGADMAMKVDGLAVGSNPPGRPNVSIPGGPTTTGSTLGTPRYMAPEQAAGHNKEVGPPADVYALGAILYELLTGQPPFPGQPFQETLRLVQERQPERPCTVNSMVDPDLELICLKCLEKNPRARYASAEALADDLARWQRGKPPRARPYISWPARLRRSIRRHPLVTTAIMLTALAALIMPVVNYFRDPVRALEPIERQLRQGHAVTLLGDEGKPAWFRWRTTEGQPSIHQAPDGSFAIQSAQYGLLELLRDPQRTHYRFSAEVRQDQCDGSNGHIGIYFAYRNYTTSRGVEHCYCALSLNDNMRIGDKVSMRPNVKTRVDFVREPQLLSSSSTLMSDLDGERASISSEATPYADGQGPWHKFAVEVTPERFSYFFEDKFIKSRPHTRIMWHFKKLFPGSVLPEDVNPEFAPRDALGLFVYHCAASFRRVLVEPLGEEE
jgi:serine/threonine protein kinase